jgi:hypothetical protein
MTDSEFSSTRSLNFACHADDLGMDKVLDYKCFFLDL